MTTRLPVIQPDECCTNPVVPMPMTADVRERTLAVLKALADGTRFDVYRLIAAQAEPICACDIVDRFEVSQPTIAHHLKVLRQAGLITVSRRGVWAYYAVNPEGAALLGPLAGSVALAPERLAAVG
jgi:ArsR family transcriptional regulator